MTANNQYVLGRILSVEDPKLIFYLKNIVWREFTRKVGYKGEYFKSRYDFALSFAGSDRAVAKALHDELAAREVAIFYDQNEQHRIISQNVEDYLAPIYQSEAHYVIVLQSPDYPTRIWTKFESDNFKERFGEQRVIPIKFVTVREGSFTEQARYGSLTYDPSKEFCPQIKLIVETLCKRLIEDRQYSVADAAL